MEDTTTKCAVCGNEMEACTCPKPEEVTAEETAETTETPAAE